MAVLMAGLLRSQAELLGRTRRQRTLTGSETPAADGDALDFDPALAPIPDDRIAIAAPPALGEKLDGTRETVDFRSGRNTLLAFLSSGCTVCETFWRAFNSADLSTLPGNAELVVVTKDRDSESPSQLLRKAPAGVRLLMSSDAWTDFDVPTAPYFVYVDGGSAEIRGEGAASKWDQVEQLLADAIADAALLAPAAPLDPGTARLQRRIFDSHPERIRQADEALLAAGIDPNHPSLWPSRQEAGEVERSERGG